MHSTIVSAFIIGCWLVAAGAVEARVPMTRTAGQRNHGTRPDGSVPYLTTGKSAFGAYQVAPRIYSSPDVQDTMDPGARQVYNLRFYGAIQSFGDRANGAVLRKW